MTHRRYAGREYAQMLERTGQPLSISQRYTRTDLYVPYGENYRSMALPYANGNGNGNGYNYARMMPPIVRNDCFCRG